MEEQSLSMGSESEDIGGQVAGTPWNENRDMAGPLLGKAMVKETTSPDPQRTRETLKQRG